MLRFPKIAVAIVLLLTLTTACSQSELTQQASASNQDLIASGKNSPAKLALAKHLKQVNAKFYGAYWCPYCHKQKELFGQQAMSQINYIECDAKGENPRPDLCNQASISSLPTWEIKGKQYPGMQSLVELADLSGYQGDRNFGN